MYIYIYSNLSLLIMYHYFLYNYIYIYIHPEVDKLCDFHAHIPTLLMLFLKFPDSIYFRVTIYIYVSL